MAAGDQGENVQINGGTASITSTTTVSTGVTEQAAIRFLEQASFGPSPVEIARVRTLGFSAYIDEQFGFTSSSYRTPQAGDNIDDVKQQFFNNAINRRDQLRQRMAFVLSEIFVVSSLDVVDVNAITSYQRMLLQKAFSNYADVLREVTLHPTMGKYLNMVNNWAGGSPNENYAREVMQLFSVGTVMLNDAGVPILDANGEQMPTYTQRDVEGMARALTGWTYPSSPYIGPGGVHPQYFYGRMESVEERHDHAQKILLGGVVLPAGQSAEDDLTDALNAISNHPNVAPFISFRLIQYFVTSNPSGAYVRRVANVFNNNGRGVRGDLKAVIKAILLDSEARRGDVPLNAGNADGRLKDPVLLVAGLMRTLRTSTDGQDLKDYAADMGQDLFSAPSVFSHFLPDYVIPGTEFLGPEFEIYITPYIAARNNFVDSVIFGRSIYFQTDLSTWAAIGGNAAALIDTINRRLFHGAMTAATRTVLADTLALIPEASPLSRAQTALYLAATSSEYFVHH